MQILILVHKCVHHNDMLPTIFKNYCQSNQIVHNHNTRTRTDLHLFSVSNNFGQLCFSYKGCKLWNNLPSKYKLFCSVEKFREYIKEHLLGKL